MHSGKPQSSAPRAVVSNVYWLLQVVIRICHWVFTLWTRIPGMFYNRRCRSTARLDGKTAIITGCNSGIGKETALEFVRRGARVVMACRNVARAHEAAGDIRARAADCAGAGEVIVVGLDLSSLTSVRRCARHILQREDDIHVLVNNAGVFSCPHTRTEDGIEMQLGVNHAGHFLLTLLLLPRMLRSAPARIINVTSVAHMTGRIDFDDLNMERSYSPYKGYARSKLANILFTKELGDRLRGTGVTTYAVHPGFVTTDISRHLHESYTKFGRWLFHTFVLFMTPEQGAQTTIHCAVDEAAASETGLYYSYCRSSTPFCQAQDKGAATKLWEVSLKLVGLDDWELPNTEDSKQVENTRTKHIQERPLITEAHKNK